MINVGILIKKYFLHPLVTTLLIKDIFEMHNKVVVSKSTKYEDAKKEKINKSTDNEKENFHQLNYYSRKDLKRKVGYSKED